MKFKEKRLLINKLQRSNLEKGVEALKIVIQVIKNSESQKIPPMSFLHLVELKETLEEIVLRDGLPLRRLKDFYLLKHKLPMKKIKRTALYPVSIWIIAIISILIISCATFAPIKDAKEKAYQLPCDSSSQEYEGSVNTKQINHLMHTDFPRLTEEERLLLIKINRNVNEKITYLSDEDNYGIIDYPITEPSAHRPFVRGLPLAIYGDCEDYALTKKHELIENGVSASRLFVVKTKIPVLNEDKFNHVVLAVPEGSDWWILDNQDNRIEPASYLAKWWGWEFVWPKFSEYQARSDTGYKIISH